MWHGYFLLTVDASITASEKQKCIGVAMQAGRTTYTDKPHEKTQIRESLNGLQFILEVSRDTVAPDMQTVRDLIAENTDITQERANELITSLYVFEDVIECRNYLINNLSLWEEVE